MSVLRKAKQKARSGIRAVNAERKRIQHIRSSGGSGKTPTSQGTLTNTTSFHFRQINDAFEAALDDESDLFEPQSDEQPNDSDLFAADSERDYVASGTSNEFTGDHDQHTSDLFEDSPKTSVRHDQTELFQDELFSDDIQPSSGNNTAVGNASTASACHDQTELFQDELFADDVQPLSCPSSNNTAVGTVRSSDLVPADSNDDSSGITNSDISNHVSSDLTTSGDIEISSDRQPSDVTAVAVAFASTLPANLEADANKDNGLSYLGVSTNVSLATVSQGSGAVEQDKVDDLFTDATPGLTDYRVEELSPKPGIDMAAPSGGGNETTGEINIEMLATEIKVEEPDELFPGNHPTSERYEKLLPEQNKLQPSLVAPTRPEYNPISPSFSPLSSLASSYEEDHFLTAHFSQPRGHSPGDLSSDDQKEKRDSSTDVRYGDTNTHKDKCYTDHPLSSVTTSHEESDTVASLEALLAPKPKAGSGSFTDELPSQHPLEVSSAHHDHFDSGVYDHYSFIASHSTETTDGEDLFAIQENYFSQGEFKETSHTNSSSQSYEKPSRKQLSSLRSPVGSSSNTPHTTPPKRNRAGKIPPQRPQMSPSLRRKLHQASPDPTSKTSTDNESHQQKHLQGKSLEHAIKKNRLVADDLFDDDSVAVQPHQYNSKTGPDSSVDSTFHHPPSKESLKQDTAGATAGDQVNSQTHPDECDEPELTLTYHLLLACLLYFHYTFSSSSYLAGLLTGFLLVFLLVGSVFIIYVSTIESEKREKKNRGARFVQPSEDFLRTMDVNFDRVKLYQVSITELLVGILGLILGSIKC